MARTEGEKTRRHLVWAAALCFSVYQLKDGAIGLAESLQAPPYVTIAILLLSPTLGIGWVWILFAKHWKAMKQLREERQAYIREIEARIDPDRTSSGIDEDGLHPIDKDPK